MRVMQVQDLNDARPGVTARWSHVKWWTILATVAALLVVFVPMPVRHHDIWIDATTGSRSDQIFWPFGITSKATVQTSPIEQRLRAIGQSWTPGWHCITSQTQTLFGREISSGCSTAPPIYQMSGAQADFVAGSTDAEVVAFVRVMETGTDPQKQSAIDAVATKLYGP